jgi:hypothetical protein
VRKIKSRTAARQARRKPRTTRRRPRQHQLASASPTTSAPDGAPANFGLVHVLKAEPLVTESPAIGERTVHHLEAGSNRLKPAQPQHPTPQQDAAYPALARIYPEGNVPSRHTGTMIYDKFKKEWDRDPELVKMKRPSKSTVLRKLRKKRH